MKETDANQGKRPEIVHAMEQLAAFIRDLGPMVHAYYVRLQGEGFTEEQAFTLARDLQRQIVPNVDSAASDD